jgi:cob(I)alamin adenosyltransferase
MSRIYTRSGDQGETSLGDGTRVPKQSLRVATYGTVDETNAAIGLARLHAKGEIGAILARIQNDLFDLGADLAQARGKLAAIPRIGASQVARLEKDRPRPRTAQVFRAAGRNGVGGRPAFRAHRRAPRRKAGFGSRQGRGGQPRGA